MLNRGHNLAADAHADARTNAIERMKGGTLDVLVVGGGIVGSGVARDAAIRGLRTALIDRHDFAFGTSSRSSRLLHGGLRYLAQGRIGLVREASVEKVIISRIAPHLAAPLPFIFPTHRGTVWKRWKLAIGVKAYDLLCSGQNLGRSQVLSADRTLRKLPGLQPKGLTGAVRYFDGLTNDARLVLDTIRSAAAAGAMVANYTALESATAHGDTWRCRVSDKLQWHGRHAHATGAGQLTELRARVVVNATGAWAASLAASGVALRLTKGVHLVIDRSRLNVPDAVVMAEGSRILFAIPWGQRVILGTTDTDYDGPIDTPTCDDSDIRYVLGVANATFPTAHLEPHDVISSWAGLRPLIAGGSNARGKPSDLSRRHQIRMTQPGWLDVAGGKLTTYRLMAEQTVDEVVAYTKRPAARCTTHNTPLLSNGHDPAYSGILPPEVSRAAVEHYCRNEWAMTLSDVMIRRTSWRYYQHDHLAVAAQVAGWMAELLDWDEPRRQRELAVYGEQTGAYACAGSRPQLRAGNAQVQTV
ncbi:MAG TPA: glycerol-3-phosphate dehydrogenase/oxidase [Tepidisphaeraceae bacterium]|nr:glycerol-3-phosphate dehydrogenase/oxidase [Tepidisphaeraceae bacterium]